MVTQETTALWVQVNMSFGTHMLTTVKQKVFVAFVCFLSSFLLWCSVNRNSLSFLQIITCRLLRLYKMDINHLLNTFDFKASQCTFFFLNEKTQWTQMDCKFMRSGCWSTRLPTMLQLSSGSLSLLLLSFSCVHPIKSDANIQ